MDARDRERIAQLGLVADQGLWWKSKYEQVQAERDTLRAELAAAKETAAISTEIASARIYQNEKQIRIHFANTREWKEALDAAKARAEAAEAHAARLRKALEQIQTDIMASNSCASTRFCGDTAIEAVEASEVKS